MQRYVQLKCHLSFLVQSMFALSSQPKKWVKYLLLLMVNNHKTISQANLRIVCICEHIFQSLKVNFCQNKTCFVYMTLELRNFETCAHDDIKVLKNKLSIGYIQFFCMVQAWFYILNMVLCINFNTCPMHSSFELRAFYASKSQQTCICHSSLAKINIQLCLCFYFYFLLDRFCSNFQAIWINQVMVAVFQRVLKMKIK